MSGPEISLATAPPGIVRGGRMAAASIVSTSAYAALNSFHLA
jgi:hypothetical protein